MSRKSKYFFLVALAQAGCLAVGLWMHHHFTISSVTRIAEEQIWSDIEAGARRLVSVLEELDLSEVNAPEMVSARLSNSYRFPFGGVMVVDPDWRVVFPRKDAEQAGARAAEHTSPLQWTPDANARHNTSEPLRGKIILEDGPHVAAVYALSNGQGYALHHYPVADFEARSAAPVRSLSVIGLITFVWMCALLGIAAYVILARLHENVDRAQSRLATDALRQTQNLVRTRDAVIFGLAKLAESRDPDTGDHLERISGYSTMIASALRRDPKFRDEVTPAFVRLIGISSVLHDIGKVGVEDRILLKPGPFTPEERAEMKTHSVIGGECLRGIERRLGGSNFLQMAREITLYHHENWDGMGYPEGLAGTAIPLSARIVAIADIYDALSSKRVYKEPLPHKECVAIIRNEAGRKLDPDLVDVWLTLESRFRGIALKYADSTGDAARREFVEPEPVEDVEQEIEDFCVTSYGASSEGH